MSESILTKNKLNLPFESYTIADYGFSSRKEITFNYPVSSIFFACMKSFTLSGEYTSLSYVYTNSNSTGDHYIYRVSGIKPGFKIIFSASNKTNIFVNESEYKTDLFTAS